MSTAEALVLHYALESAKGERKTGNLHVLASSSGSVKNAILVVNSGELIGCNYWDRVGKDAVRMLLKAVALKAIFVRKDVSAFTPHPGIPTVEDVLRELHAVQPTESAVQRPARQAFPETYGEAGGKLQRGAEILATVLGKDEAKQQIREIMKHSSPDDDIEGYVEACIDLAASYVGEHTARMMFEEISSSGD